MPPAVRHRNDMKTQMIVILSILCVCSCAADDPFSAPAIELRTRLSTFERTADPDPIYEWVNTYHGEASGMHLFHTFTEWGNEHQKAMSDLLANWPADTKDRIYELLRWNAKDAGLPIEFEIPSDK